MKLQNLSLALFSQGIKSEDYIAQPSTNEKPEIGTTKLPKALEVSHFCESHLLAKFQFPTGYVQFVFPSKVAICSAPTRSSLPDLGLLLDLLMNCDRVLVCY